MIDDVFIKPVLRIIDVLTCKRTSLIGFSDKIKGIYEEVFQMSKLEVEGFRRMRTMS
jgi:hypothetical protein